MCSMKDQQLNSDDKAQESDLDDARDRPPGVTSGSPRRPVQKLEGAIVALDLDSYVRSLRADAGWRVGVPNTITILKEPGLRLVVIALRAGTHIKEHLAPGRITIQTISGHTRVRLSETDVDLPLGHLVSLEPALAHDVFALEESAILLTIAWPIGETS